MTNQELPDALRRKVTADLRPVRPLRSPAQRAWLVVPALALAWMAGPVLLGLRGDVTTIGPWLSWGASLLQFLVAAALVAVVFREAAPGEATPRSTGVGLMILAALLSVAVGWATSLVSPEPVLRRETFASWEFCWARMVAVGAPLVALLGVLLARGLPFRPALAGALAGLGAGVAVDGGWRLYCNYSSVAHVFSSHGGAVVALTLTGCVLGLAIGRWSDR